jgi:Right handed beta helix region
MGEQQKAKKRYVWAMMIGLCALVRAQGSYVIDPVHGDDGSSAGPWKTFGRLNAAKLCPGDTVLINPGVQEESLMPSGEGTAQQPIVIKFLPGIHTLNIKKVQRKQLFISNSIDYTEPIPVGIILSQIKHVRVQGGGVEGTSKTTLLYDGRMMQILNERAEDIEYSGLVLDMKRPSVSEIRVLEEEGPTLVVQVAEGSDYQIENGKFYWRGDWLGGQVLTQQIELKTGACRRRGAFRGWTSAGQTEAKATDLGERKVKFEFPNGTSGLLAGHQYHFRNGSRLMCGVHSTRSARITFRDCEVNALPCMGFVSQFTDTMTFQRVNVVPPANTIRTCPAWADIFQFSNCKGDILVESCKLSGMQDDALNCHGTYLCAVEKRGAQQLLVRYVHRQTYGFAPYTAGDEIAVMNAGIMREYPNNPRAQVTGVERITDKDWLVTLRGPVPNFSTNDVVDNITWNPNITVRNNHVSVDPVRGFLLGTRGKIIIENNTFERCRMPGILVEGDAVKWFESSPIRDMLVRSNRFIECGIEISSTVRAPKPEQPVHENIRISENMFEGGGIHAKSTRGLSVTDNRSTGGKLPMNIDPSCTEVTVERNQ